MTGISQAPLQKLPVELLFLIAAYLNTMEFYNFCICNGTFLPFLWHEDLCKRILQASPSFTLTEQQGSVEGRYAWLLRSKCKRSEAISSAKPFGAVVIAKTDSPADYQPWIYRNGVLCYIYGRQLRVLDIHRSADQEIVVDISELLNDTIQRSYNATKGVFRLLYHAHGIVSYSYTYGEFHHVHWLVVLKPSESKVITRRSLNSAHNIFVRNNTEFLYYGVQSDIGDEDRQWVLEGFDFGKNEWFPDSLELGDVVGSDIDSTICFEIIGDHFYILTNSNCSGLTAYRYTSYYDFSRFPLDRPSNQNMEQPKKRDLFRRQNNEGIIDDRWTSLKIYTDDLSGEVRILESRDEKLWCNNFNTRTCYMKTLTMCPRLYETDEDDQYTEGYPLAEYLGLPNTNGRPPDRDSSDVHQVDDSSTSLMIPVRKCYIHDYIPLSHASLVLTDDPVPSGPHRIQILVMSRQQRDFQQDQTGSTWEERRTAWPPEPSAGAANLHEILNPPDFRGVVSATSDDRSLVYSDGRVLILVHFAPEINMKGSFKPDNSDQSGNLDAAILKRPTTPAHERQASKEELVNNTVDDVVVGEGGKVVVNSGTWSIEPAMYCSINLGFNFAERS